MQFLDFVDDDGEFAVLEAMVNKKFNEKSTLFTYAVALGVPADDLNELDTDDLVGKAALCLVKNEESNKGGVWPRVKNMVPLPKGYTAGQQVTPSVIQPDGQPNWAVFYQVLKEKKGWAKAQVGDHLNMDMEKLGKHLSALDGPDAQDLLDELLAK
jgi:hypothetical protein